jgi:hypothetical protein
LWPLILVLLVLAAGGIGIAMFMREQTVAAPPPDAAMTIDAMPDAALADAAVPDAAVPDAAPIDARRITSRVDAAPTGPTKSFQIGANPWAFFTVDGDPKEYETPMTLKLTVGPHRVTFRNPQLNISRTVTITVPPNDEGRHVEKMN